VRTYGRYSHTINVTPPAGYAFRNCYCQYRSGRGWCIDFHLHARDPDTGKPDPRPEIFSQFLQRIKQSSDAVVNISTGGGLGMTMDERLLAATTASPEMASLNMGSMNFGAKNTAPSLSSNVMTWGICTTLSGLLIRV